MTGLTTSLLVILTVANTLAIIALTRQVGILHLRARPLPALESEEGPIIGSRVQLNGFREAIQHYGGRNGHVLVGFVSPSCRLCHPLLPAFDALRRQIRTVLVVDGSESRAAEYLRGQQVHAPHIAYPGVFLENSIPGTPFAVVTDVDGTVRAAGGVNSLEQIEYLVQAAAASNDSDRSLIEVKTE